MSLPGQPRQPTLIKLGQIRISPGAETLLDTHGIPAMELLTRHQHGDFGILSPTEWNANLKALLSEARICSAYPLYGQTLLVITDPKPRPCTTLCLSEELPS